MKILFLTHRFCPTLGGIEVISEILANHFVVGGHEVHLLTWEKDNAGKTFPFTVIRTPTLQQLVKEHFWADLVFENNPCIRLGWPNVLSRKPRVIVLHTWISRTDGTVSIKDLLKIKLWLGTARKVIAVSTALRNVCWPNASIITNPYRADLFRTIPEIARTGDFVFLGRLVSDKGVHIAIRAIDKLKELWLSNDFYSSKPSLTIIGDGPERESLKRLVAELKLEDCVSFVGALAGETLVRTLNKHRFLLLPSEWEEPFGVVALEGIACGCVPIVSNCGGLPEAVGNAGITFERSNVDSLVTRILQLISNPALEQKLRMSSTEHLVSHDPTNVALQYLQVIEEAIEK